MQIFPFDRVIGKILVIKNQTTVLNISYSILTPHRQTPFSDFR